MNALTTANKFLSENNYGDALACLKEFIATQKANPQAEPYYLIGVTYQRMDDHETALNYFAICLQIEPNHYNSHLELGVSYFHCDNLDDAEKSLLTYIKFRSKDPKPYFYLGKVHEALKFYKEAQEDYIKCLELQPSNMACRKLLSRLQRKFSSTSQGESKEINILRLKKRVFQIQVQNEKLLDQNKVKDKCKVCKENQPSRANKACGHFSICETCQEKVKGRCPICAKQGEFIKIFFT